MTQPDVDYYGRREQQERESAARCDDHGARRIHLELAERYSSMRRQLIQVPAQQA
jgi:hypothetical protein